jgi:hypothetical protein
MKTAPPGRGQGRKFKGGRPAIPLSYGRGVGVRVRAKRPEFNAHPLIRPTVVGHLLPEGEGEEAESIWLQFTLNEAAANFYIAVSEPWPFGVVMPSHVPLATYFQWPGS